MTRYLIAGTAVVALAGWGWWQHSRAEALAANLMAAQSRIVGYEAAAVVHRAHIQRLERITADAVTLDREFQQEEGADAPLDDYLRRGAGRLWQ